MSTSDRLHKLTDKAKETEQKAADARHQARADLEKNINSSRAAMESRAARLREGAKESRGKASTWWQEQQVAWNAHIDKIHTNMDERKVQHDAKVADQQANQAEADADFAIDYAYGAIEMAEYAVLDAILARENADEAQAAAAVPSR